MQHKDNKTLFFQKTLGKLISKLRKERTKLSCAKLAREYGMHSGHLNMIENGKIECKVVTLLRISESLGLKTSEFFKILEDELGDDFKLMDE